VSTVRALALTCVVMTALGAIAALAAFTGWDPVWMAYVRALIHLAEAGGILALGLAGLAGEGVLGRLGVGLAVLGSLVLAVAEGVDPANDDVGTVLFAIGPLAAAAGLVLAGVAVLRARRIPGPARLLPLVLGVYIVVVLMPTIIVTGGPPAPAALLVLAVLEIGWVLIGATVLAGVREPARVAVG
jgi:hypothetical protein